MLKVFLVGMMAMLTAAFGLVAWVSLRPAPVAVVEAPPVVVAAPAPPPPPAPKVMVLAVMRAMRPGELLRPEDLGPVEAVSTGVPDGAQVDGPASRADLSGAMVRRSLAAMQPILPGDVLRPTDGGFLAAVLMPNRRAVSIAVDAVSGTAGLIWPGDRVDLILTQALEEANIPMGRRIFSETVLRDVRVIAVDQQLAHGVTPDGANGGGANRTVTLEVAPDEAERVAVAVRLGKVALSVRASGALAVAAAEPALGAASAPAAAAGPAPGASAGGGAPVLRNIAQTTTVAAAASALAAANPAASKAAGTTWGSDVSPALTQRAPAPAAAPNKMRVYQGSAGEKEFKFE